MVRMLTPEAVCYTSIWIFCAKDSASSCELAWARMTAEILTSLPDSPWTLTSPNLCSTRTDWPAPRVKVLSKFLVTSSCGQVSADDARDGASKSIAAIPAVAPTPRKRLRFAFDTNHLIAFPPKRLRAFAAFPDTWPEAAGEDAHWTDSVRPECADR